MGFYEFSGQDEFGERPSAESGEQFSKFCHSCASTLFLEYHGDGGLGFTLRRLTVSTESESNEAFRTQFEAVGRKRTVDIEGTFLGIAGTPYLSSPSGALRLGWHASLGQVTYRATEEVYQTDFEGRIPLRSGNDTYETLAGLAGVFINFAPTFGFRFGADYLYTPKGEVSPLGDETHEADASGLFWYLGLHITI